MPDVPDPEPVKHKLKVLPPFPGPERDASPVHDVKAILLANQKKEEGLRINGPITYRRKMSRRMKDYLACVLGGTLVICLLVYWEGLNAVNIVYGLAAIMLLSVGLAWTMFQVMDKY
jgi:hypothetical protein